MCQFIYVENNSIIPLSSGDRVVKGKSEKCHAELVSASKRIKDLRDPEMNSG
jgi:hypothetical protein